MDGEINTDQSQEIGELVTALVQVQTEIKPIAKTKTAKIKTKKGADYSYQYVDFGSVWDSCRNLLTTNGLAVIQTTAPATGGVLIITTLAHTSGQWIRGHLFISSGADPRSMGSAITYGRRYGFSAIVGLVTDEDDDGDGAGRGNNSDGGNASNRNDAPQGASKSPETHCLFGKDNGREWSDMSLDKLNWYKDTFEQTIDDPQKIKFKPMNKRYLKGVLAALDDKEAKEAAENHPFNDSAEGYDGQ